LAAGQEGSGDMSAIREALYETMWDDVGILRTGSGLERALGRLAELDAELSACGVADGDRAFNLSWHDWINLRNLIAVSRTIAAAALSRQDSRGAHFREDFPQTDDLEQSSYTVVSQHHGALVQRREPVLFSRVRPGKTILVKGAAAAEVPPAGLVQAEEGQRG
jgi:fumarate reductase flavoprotein subunit